MLAHVGAPTAVRQLKLVGLDWLRQKDPKVPLGTASISAHLKSQGIEHQLRSFAVNDPGFRPDEVISWALDGLASRDGRDACLCFGAFIWAEKELQYILQGIRDGGFRGTIALGGPQVGDVLAAMVRLWGSVQLGVPSGVYLK